MHDHNVSGCRSLDICIECWVIISNCFNPTQFVIHWVTECTYLQLSVVDSVICYICSCDTITWMMSLLHGINCLSITHIQVVPGYVRTLHNCCTSVLWISGIDCGHSDSHYNSGGTVMYFHWCAMLMIYMQQHKETIGHSKMYCH